MAAAARRRLERDHTWEKRLGQMLSAAGLSVDRFTIQGSADP